MFREIGGNGAFRSIASARSFPIVGQLVGQELRIGLLKIEFALRYTEYKIVLQPGRLRRNDVIPLEHRPQIGKVFFILLGQRCDPFLLTANGLGPQQFFSAHFRHWNPS